MKEVKLDATGVLTVDVADVDARFVDVELLLLLLLKLLLLLLLLLDEAEADDGPNDEYEDE